MPDPSDLWDDADWSERYELVKQTVPLWEVAEMLGLEPDRNDKIVLPGNDERTPSCHLFDDHWHCFSTGQHGDAVDLVRLVDPDLSAAKAAWLIWSKGLRAGHEPGDVEREPPRQLMDFTREIGRYHHDPEMDWAGVRYELGVQYIPHAEPGRVYGVKTRGPAGKAALPGSQFSHRLYDPLGWTSSAAHDSIILCEGESDAWAMTLALPGQRVVALPSGAPTWKDHWLKDLEPYETVHICMDNDKAGKNALEKITRKVGWARAKTLRVPPLFNDAREAIEAGWKPEVC